MNWTWWQHMRNTDEYDGFHRDENGVLHVIISPIPEWMLELAEARIAAARAGEKWRGR